MEGTRSAASGDGYVVRPYRADDRERFLALYDDVWDARKGAAWFEWRFEANPYRDDVAMVVAERDGDLVGAEPLLPLPLRVGDRVLDVVQPVDWMVHPDHRRRGVFTRMTEHLLEAFADEAALLFNFPNDQLLPGLESFDWRRVDEVATSYRVQDASAVVDERLAAGVDDRRSSLAPAAARVGAPLVRRGLDVLDRVRSPPDDVTVTRHDDVPAAAIRECYASAPPDAAHVPRDRAYVEWRFANPRWETTAYVARRDGDPVASVVAGAETVGDTELVRLLDVQPAGATRPDAFEALLVSVLTDASDADLLTAPPDQYADVLKRYGFWRDDAFPLSAVTTTTTHVVRPLGDGDECNVRADGGLDGAAADSAGSQTTPDERTDAARSGVVVQGRDLTEPESWHLALADRDLA